MTDSTVKKQYLYEFRGEEITCDVETVKILNYALALNRSTDRYVRISKRKKQNKDLSFIS